MSQTKVTGKQKINQRTLMALSKNDTNNGSHFNIDANNASLFRTGTNNGSFFKIVTSICDQDLGHINV